MNLKRSWIWMVALVEGGAVMAVEIASAKLIAPWFGASLYVWSSVLGVTLLGLAGGYFAGGRLSQGSRPALRLAVVLLIAGLLVLLMPVIGPAIMAATLHWEPRWGSLASAIIFLMPPIACLGMVSPLLVGLSGQLAAGRAAGTVYGISTLGGIAMTFAMGFYIMPTWGLRMPLMVIGGLLALMGLALALRFRKWPPVAAGAAIAILAGWLGSGHASHPAGVLWQEWGLQGRVEVADHPSGRVVRIDGREQTRMALDGDSCALHAYVATMARLAATQPQGSRCLLLGVGGGSLLRELDAMGHQVQGCELDPRMLDVAGHYFGAPLARHAILAQDARWCINNMEGRYQVIVVDVFWGLHGPSHVLTLESCQRLRSHLHTQGLMIVLFPGPPAAAPATRLVATLQAAGFRVAMALPDGLVSQSMVLVATHLPFGPDHFHQQLSTPCLEELGYQALVPAAALEADPGAAPFVDDKPALEYLLRAQ